MALPTSALLTAPALTLLALAGCGTAKIDAGKTEGLIRRSVTGQVGARVKSVSCPSGHPAKAGGDFTCEVVGADGTKGTAKVHQKDDKGNVVVSSPFLHMREVETKIAAEIRRQLNVSAKVRCPEIVEVTTGRVVMCKAAAQGQSRNVRVRLTDAKGNFHFDLV